MSSTLKISLIAVLSFLFGWMLFKGANPKVDSSVAGLNKTKVIRDGDEYFIVFSGIVILSRRITKEEYDIFITEYPSGEAIGNVIDKFSTPPPKYTREGDKYFEYVWTGNDYSQGIEITKEEFVFRSKNNLRYSALPEVL